MNPDNDNEIIDDKIPLLVDLDGAIVATDTLFETTILFLKKSPLMFFMLFVWLLRGKHVLKEELSKRTCLNVETLPYRQDVIDYLEQQSKQGRKIVLLTGSWVDIGRRVANKFTFISDVIATNDAENMTGRTKAKIARERWGAQLFDYLGNEKKDLQIWKIARRAIVVGNERLAKAAKDVTKLEKVFPVEPISFRIWLKAIRIHQWTKNLLIFVPLLTSHSLFEQEAVISALIAYFSFCTVASATYLLNDFLDLESDRKHSTKKYRPLASGKMSILQGILAGIVLLSVGFILAIFFLNMYFLLVLLSYLTLTILYSFILKHLQTADVISLASLFTLRIIAGAAAIGVPLSFWLLCFSMFLFLSLAMVKRVSELIHLEKQSDSESQEAMGRDYLTADIVVLQSLGGASGFMSVLVFALYINSDQVVKMYSSPEFLWLVIPVVGYWVMRIWIIAARGQVDEDPISFAIQDKQSWLTTVVLFFIFALAAVL